MKVCRLVGNPSQIAAYVVPLTQLVHSRVGSCELAVRDEGMDCTVTDWVDGDGLPAAFALGHDVMPLHAPS
jgi:hypothetical protein